METAAVSSSSCFSFNSSLRFYRHNININSRKPALESICLFSRQTFRLQPLVVWNSSDTTTGTKAKHSNSKRRNRSSGSSKVDNNPNTTSTITVRTTSTDTETTNNKYQKAKNDGVLPVNANVKVKLRGLHQNGDPLGHRDIGKSVVRWISQGMRAMASDFASAEVCGEFSDLKHRTGPGLTFVIQAQPYLNAVPMPLGLEAICLKACTHYPTLFDHFQRELRDVLQDLQRKSLLQNWCDTESWKLLKELANSAQHRAIARKVVRPKTVQGVLGMDLEKAKAIQIRIDEFTKRMSELLRIERDAELEFTQEELDAVPTPTPDETSHSSRPIEFLVSHGQAQQELCDTICNLNAVSTSTGQLKIHCCFYFHKFIFYQHFICRYLFNFNPCS